MSTEIDVRIAVEQAALASSDKPLTFSEARVRQAALAILRDAGVSRGELSVAVVADATIHDLNRRFLDHDSPTDVLSFLLEADSDDFRGEVVASIETAAREAAAALWSTDDELLLYIVHGVLHLVGFDDCDHASQAKMRERERHYLGQFGMTPRYDV